MLLNTKEIITLSEQISEAVLAEDRKTVIKKLKPILDTKCSFSKLDKLGNLIGESCKKSPSNLFPILDEIISYNSMGSYVIAGKALVSLLEKDFSKVMEKSRQYIIFGDKWYVCDIIGERSIGEGLVNHFNHTLPWLKKFLDDENRWVQRSAGVSIHYFSKRVPDKPQRTKKLLNLITPYIEIKQKDVVKGIGWGVKTIGKYHPEIATEFLIDQLKQGKNPSKLFIRKALTYLPERDKLRVKDLLHLSA